MSIHDHNILISFAGELICQRQAEDTCANDDDPVARVHHRRVQMSVVRLCSTRGYASRNKRYSGCAVNAIKRRFLTPYLLQIPDGQLGLMT